MPVPVELSELTDEQLLTRISDAEWLEDGQESFSILWCRYESRVKAQISKMCAGLSWGRRLDMREDVLSRVQLKLLKQHNKFKEGSFEKFLYVLVKNAWIDAYRMEKLRRGRFVEPDDPDFDDIRYYSLHVRPQSPETSAQNADRREKLQRAVEEIAKKNGWKKARAIKLRFMDELEIREVAEQLGVTERTVYRWLDEGLEEMQTFLGGLGVASVEDL